MQHSEGLGCRLGTTEYCCPDLALILTGPQERKKKNLKRAQSPSTCSIQEDQHIPPGRFKVSRRLFFPNCKTINLELRND